MTAPENAFAWQCLQGNYSVDDERAGWFSPSRAASLEGLPETFIATGAIDLFVDENIEYAQLLLNAGVPTELHVYPGAPHGFNWVADAAVSKQFWNDFFRVIAQMAAK